MWIIKVLGRFAGFGLALAADELSKKLASFLDREKPAPQVPHKRAVIVADKKAK